MSSDPQARDRLRTGPADKRPSLVASDSDGDGDGAAREAHTPFVADRAVASPSEPLHAWAQCHERVLQAVLADGDVDQLLTRLLGILIDVARVDVGVVRLRQGAELRSRAALGLEAEVIAGATFPLEQAKLEPASDAALGRVAADDACRSPIMHGRGVAALYRLPLYERAAATGARGNLLGVIYLGALSDHELSDEQRRLLEALAGHVAAALAARSSVEALTQAVRARDQVLAVVAHDLRNPINVISMAADGLLRRETNSLARRPIERIIRGAQRAERLIADLLEIDAIEGGRFSLETQRVETADVILAALESQQNLAASASVIIATDLSPALPAVEGDADRLLEVLENLVDNAIKFTKPGGSVTVGATSRDGEVLIWVKDSGSGIPRDQLPHLFDRFWQAKKKDRRGTGLGLTICKAIVEAHRGRIWAESAIGTGTTMYFTIPASGACDTRSAALDVSSILIVDDRPENLISLQAILARPDYRLVTARSGSEALGFALRERFTVALIDIAMPIMNGLEVAVHLKGLERSRDIPIIFITAFGEDPEEIHRAYSAGGADYLVKPLDPEIVRKKVAVFVDLNRKRQSSQLPPPPSPRPAE
jgi:signal transduction histidine kinase/ActR/RegA family two-component response regulator